MEELFGSIESTIRQTFACISAVFVPCLPVSPFYNSLENSVTLTERKTFIPSTSPVNNLESSEHFVHPEIQSHSVTTTHRHKSRSHSPSGYTGTFAVPYTQTEEVRHIPFVGRQQSLSPSFDVYLQNDVTDVISLECRGTIRDEMNKYYQNDHFGHPESFSAINYNQNTNTLPVSRKNHSGSTYRNQDLDESLDNFRNKCPCKFCNAKLQAQEFNPDRGPLSQHFVENVILKAPCEEAAGDDHIVRVYNGICYEFIDTKAPYDFANNYCRAKNAILVDIKNQETQDFLIRTVKTDLRLEWEYAYIGARKDTGGGPWYGPHDNKIEFSAWVDGDGRCTMPFDFMCIENNAVLNFMKNKWEDVAAIDFNYYICQYGSEQKNCPFEIGKDPNVKVYNGYCYEFVNKEMGHKDAEPACVRNGGLLVEINDAETDKFILNTINKLQNELGWRWNDAYIGLFRNDGVEPWRWTNYKEVEYSNWGSDYCGASVLCSLFKCTTIDLRTKKWDDVLCSGSYYFICQYRLSPKQKEDNKIDKREDNKKETNEDISDIGEENNGDASGEKGDGVEKKGDNNDGENKGNSSGRVRIEDGNEGDKGGGIGGDNSKKDKSKDNGTAINEGKENKGDNSEDKSGENLGDNGVNRGGRINGGEDRKGGSKEDNSGTSIEGIIYVVIVGTVAACVSTIFVFHVFNRLRLVREIRRTLLMGKGTKDVWHQIMAEYYAHTIPDFDDELKRQLYCSNIPPPDFRIMPLSYLSSTSVVLDTPVSNIV